MVLNNINTPCPEITTRKIRGRKSVRIRRMNIFQYQSVGIRQTRYRKLHLRAGPNSRSLLLTPELSQFGRIWRDHESFSRRIRTTFSRTTAAQPLTSADRVSLAYIFRALRNPPQSVYALQLRRAVSTSRFRRICGNFCVQSAGPVCLEHRCSTCRSPARFTALRWELSILCQPLVKPWCPSTTAPGRLLSV